MSRETRGQGTNVVAWAGWDASTIDALLDAETGSDAIGFTLARVLGSRLLPSPTARFRFRLYRYWHEDGSYRLVGAWDERCLEEGAVPESPELLERQEAEAEPPDFGLVAEQFLDEELFLPLESRNGVLGFGVLRVDSAHVPADVSVADLQFLGRLAGAGLSRLNESDRAVRMHRSFESASRHLDAVLSMATDAFLLIDMRGVLQIANEAALELLGRTAKELVGHQINTLLPTNAADGLHRALIAAEDAEGKISAEIEIDTDGGSQPIEVTVQQLQSDLEVDPTLLVRLRTAVVASSSEVGECHAEELSGPRFEMSSSSALDSDPGSVPATDEAETLRRHIRSIRGYLGLLRDELQPTGRDSDLFRQLQVQLEWLQAQSDVHALLEAIRTGQVTWRDRSVRVTDLIDRAISRVRNRLSFRSVEVERTIRSESSRVYLDPEKWSILLAVLIDRATEPSSVKRVLVGVREDAAFSVAIETVWEEDGGMPGFEDLEEDDRSHGLALVRHMVAHYSGSLRTLRGETGHPVIRLDVPLQGESARVA